MEPDETTREVTSETGDEWRRLGYYHEPDPARHVWRIIGSRKGLGQFVEELRDCARRPSGDEHGARLGPYGDLVVYRWERSGIDDQGIYGPAEALLGLADTIESKLGAPGTIATVGREYASDVEYRLHFEVREDDFDPVDVLPAATDDVTGAMVAATEGDQLDVADEAFVSPSVPCYYVSDAELTETHGIVRIDGFDVVMQYETKDAFFGTFRSGPKEERLPIEEVSTVSIKRGFFGGIKLMIQTRDMLSTELPTAKAGLIRLKFKKANREAAEELAQMLADALAEFNGETA